MTSIERVQATTARKRLLRFDRKAELERRRDIVRRFFNDFWKSADVKPVAFAERLNQAEGYINERLAAGGETWQLNSATRKQLGLPPHSNHG